VRDHPLSGVGKELPGPPATTAPNKTAAMLRYFALSEHPFTLRASPRWQFVTGTNRSSLDRLLMCISNRNGLASIIGPYGVGKSMLVRRLQEALTSYGGNEVRLISNPNLTGLQLLKLICEIYGLEKVRQRDEQLEVFKRFVIDCYDRDIHPVLVIDEAHELSSGHGGFGGFSLLKLLNNYAGGEGRASFAGWGGAGGDREAGAAGRRRGVQDLRGLDGP